MTIEGIVEDIKYRNELNTYTVAVLSTSDGEITIVGYIPVINVGETLKVEGEWVYHPSYGEQIKVSSVSIVLPSTVSGIEKYLSSGLIPNIGPKTAKKIVEKFGLDTFDIMQYNPERLKEIEGIGEKKFKTIVKAFREQGEIREIMVFLQQYGISPNYGIKIYKEYGKETINIISENPYKLSEDITGIGFKTADKIAQNLGISKRSPYRIQGGIRYTLNSYGSNGHTYVPKDELIKVAKKLLEVEEALIEDGIRELAVKGAIHTINYQNEIRIYYRPFHIAENNVSKKIVELSQAEIDNINIDINKAIKDIEKEENIKFAKNQIVAIKESVKSSLVVITGGPGTGKTTIINAIIKIFEKEGLKVNLAAPTGRAAKRMTETTGIEAKTIHRLLEYSYKEEGMLFGLDEENPLDTDLLIIDEASMIDILLMNSLLKAVSIGTRLILVGDVDQLPSVGPGNVLRDIINSNVVKVVRLNEIFRQGEESLIVLNAHRINRGDYPILNKGKDFFFIRCKEPKAIVNTIIQLCKERLPKYYGVDPINDIQVLTPMKKGEIGINSLNKHLQNALNPKAKSKKEKEIGQEVFRVGDKVMQIKNNYSLEWEIISDGIAIEKGEGVFNGDLGRIIDIDEDMGTIKVIFDEEKEVEYNFSQLDEVKLSYATTVHKSQGSEFPVVVMPIYWGPPMLFTRNLLYTAITRAKSLVVLVGEEKYLKSIINNNRIAKRYSSLDLKIRSILSMYWGGNMEIFKSIGNFLFPEKNICLFCKDYVDDEGKHICKNCTDLIDFIHREIDFNSPYLQKIYYSVVYNRFIRENIHSFKFNGKNYMYKAFGDMLLQTIYNKELIKKIDIVAFVPMHRSKKAKRGYNQCELLAKYVSKAIEKPLLKNSLIKIKNTKEQNKLGMLERRTNLKGAFKAIYPKAFAAKEILLIDDIITTGATMEEISKVLIESGAKKVYGLAITSSMKIWGDYMNVRNCKRCGKLYIYDGYDICIDCRMEDEKDFKKVKEYLEENAKADIMKVSEDTGVDSRKIIEFLRQGRLELSSENNILLQCERCGTPIKTGRFCSKCALEMEKEFKKAGTNKVSLGDYRAREKIRVVDRYKKDRTNK